MCHNRKCDMASSCVTKCHEQPYARRQPNERDRGRDFSGERGCMAVDLSYMMTRRPEGLRAMVADQPNRIERRLAAILAADVAGYSRLMGLDEVGTARILREHRAVSDGLVAKHGGRIVKTTGDGILLEFPSVVDAVECAVAVQAVMAERNQGVPEDPAHAASDRDQSR